MDTGFITRNRGLRTGVFFGTASGVITTLGLIVGLHAGTESLLAVLGGILVIAVSDSMSDAFGIHLSEEAHSDATVLGVWMATLSTFAAKFIVAATFIVPLLLIDNLQTGVIAAIVWGALLLTLLSIKVARLQKVAAVPVVTEHLAIGLLVIISSWFVGTAVHRLFGIA